MIAMQRGSIIFLFYWLSALLIEGFFVGNCVFKMISFDSKIVDMLCRKLKNRVIQI